MDCASHKDQAAHCTLLRLGFFWTQSVLFGCLPHDADHDAPLRCLSKLPRMHKPSSLYSHTHPFPVVGTLLHRV